LDLESSLLYLDEALLGLNKPAGLPTLPEGWEAGAPHVKSLLEPRYGPLWIVHRLDKETSGALLLARSAQAHRSLNGQFAGRRVEKVYHALVFGNPSWQEHTAALPLRSNTGRRHRTVVDPEGGKPAETRLRVLERFEGAALVEAAPKTGRTHQIRVHLWALGHPILGDPLYTLPVASASPPMPIERLGLHSWSVAFDHPVTGEGCGSRPLTRPIFPLRWRG
jgi:RluA family pseudouridine synthase